MATNFAETDFSACKHQSLGQTVNAYQPFEIFLPESTIIGLPTSPLRQTSVIDCNIGTFSLPLDSVAKPLHNILSTVDSSEYN